MVEGRGNRKGEREWEREGLKSRSKSWQRQQLHDVQEGSFKILMIIDGWKVGVPKVKRAFKG